MKPLIKALATAIITAPFILILFSLTKEFSIYEFITTPGWNSFKLILGLVFLVSLGIYSKK